MGTSRRTSWSATRTCTSSTVSTSATRARAGRAAATGRRRSGGRSRSAPCPSRSWSTTRGRARSTTTGTTGAGARPSTTRTRTRLLTVRAGPAGPAAAAAVARGRRRRPRGRQLDRARAACARPREPGVTRELAAPAVVGNAQDGARDLRRPEAFEPRATHLEHRGGVRSATDREAPDAVVTPGRVLVDARSARALAPAAAAGRDPARPREARFAVQHHFDAFGPGVEAPPLRLERVDLEHELPGTAGAHDAHPGRPHASTARCLTSTGVGRAELAAGERARTLPQGGAALVECETRVAELTQLEHAVAALALRRAAGLARRAPAERAGERRVGGPETPGLSWELDHQTRREQRELRDRGDRAGPPLVRERARAGQLGWIGALDAAVRSPAVVVPGLVPVEVAAARRVVAAGREVRGVRSGAGARRGAEEVFHEAIAVDLRGHGLLDRVRRDQHEI